MNEELMDEGLDGLLYKVELPNGYIAYLCK